MLSKGWLWLTGDLCATSLGGSLIKTMQQFAKPRMNTGYVGHPVSPWPKHPMDILREEGLQIKLRRDISCGLWPNPWVQSSVGWLVCLFLNGFLMWWGYWEFKDKMWGLAAGGTRAVSLNLPNADPLIQFLMCWHPAIKSFYCYFRTLTLLLWVIVYISDIQDICDLCGGLWPTG